MWSKRAARQASSFTHAPRKASGSRELWESAQTLQASAHTSPAFSQPVISLVTWPPSQPLEACCFSAP